MLKKWTVSELSAIKKKWVFLKSVFIFLLSNFCTLFAKNGLFAIRPPFFESLITQKRFIFEESYI